MKKNQLIFIFLALGLFVFMKVYYINLSISNDFFENQDGDASHYLKIAETISNHFTYSDTNTAKPSESATWRPPVLPFLLAIFYSITDNNLLLIIFKSIFELGLFLWGFYMVMKKQAVYGTGAVFIIIAILEPQYIKYSLTFLSESLTAVLLFLLAVVFTIYKPNEKASYLLPILAALIILTHPVSAFFVLSILGLYFLLWIKRFPKQVIMQLMIFGLLSFIWPLRNAVVFDRGAYLTASQGATFSKGWNEEVIKKFTNVDGDLANEELNLQYVSAERINTVSGILELSDLYKEATYKFMENASTSTLFKIAITKLKSNFNPFPENQKNTFIDKISIPFRIVYLFVFFQAIYFLVFRRIDMYSFKGKMALVVISIIVAQTFMSIYIYTGLRFNSIYGIVLLTSFIILNESWIKRVLTWRQL